MVLSAFIIEFSEVLASTDSVYPLVRGKAQVNDSIVFFLPLEAVTAQTQVFFC